MTAPRLVAGAPRSSPEDPPAPCCGTPVPPGLLCLAFGARMCPGCVVETLALLLALRDAELARGA